MSITIHQTSILESDADAIVNPANLFLRNGAGLAKIIDNAARGNQNGRNYTLTPAQARYGNEVHKVPTITTGNVAVTSAGVLPFKGIIHAVGPVWEDGSYFERELLERLHFRICQAAMARFWGSVALPAISCGLFRFPAHHAAPCAIRGVKMAADAGLNVRFHLLEDAHVRAWTEALDSAGLSR